MTFRDESGERGHNWVWGTPHKSPCFQAVKVGMDDVLFLYVFAFALNSAVFIFERSSSCDRCAWVWNDTQREKSIFLFFNSLSKKKASWTGRISFCWELAYSHQLWLGSLIEENSLNIQHWNRELVKGTTVGWKEENQRPNDWIKGSACGFCYGFFHRMNKGGEATRKAMPLCRRG